MNAGDVTASIGCCRQGIAAFAKANCSVGHDSLASAVAAGFCSDSKKLTVDWAPATVGWSNLEHIAVAGCHIQNKGICPILEADEGIAQWMAHGPAAVPWKLPLALMACVPKLFGSWDCLFQLNFTAAKEVLEEEDASLWLENYAAYYKVLLFTGISIMIPMARRLAWIDWVDLEP